MGSCLPLHLKLCYQSLFSIIQIDSTDIPYVNSNQENYNNKMKNIKIPRRQNSPQNTI